MDGLAKASILDINGLTVPSAIAAPAAAFSVRLLGSGVGISSYTGDCMRVRRASDNVEADVGFDSNNELSLTSPISNTSNAQSYTDLADFVDHTGTPTSAFCRYWYDQSGNSNDAGTATEPNQPKIYDATTGLIEEGSAGNEKPALDFDGSNDKIQFPAAINASFYYSIFIARQGTTGIFLGSLDTNQYWMDIGVGGTSTSLQSGFNGPFDGALDYAIFRKNGATAFSTTTTRAEYATAFYDGNQVLMSALTDGSAETATLSNFNLGSYTGGGFAYNGNCQEFIMYQSTTSNQSSNASAIETDINGYFNIY